ncbi:alpha/beta-hydrolase [Athelia psychrophila]|uniref:Alpha/beta-hydrolase n=1 Tax=Athelia psychrophila TaxID=1759441 RepID=A0A166WZH4_9AGAM|nr:alpha/beta-hydrolase [Fibularhizoctonia sp. CBS 109695]
MPPAAEHPWSTQYVQLKLAATLSRIVGGTITWLHIIGGAPLKGIASKRVAFPSRDRGRDIAVDIYTPEGCDTSQPRPVLVNMHGSGFIISTQGIDRAFCAFIAAHTPCTVLDIAYRKAPEHPFPAALEDVQDVLAYLPTRPAQFDASSIFLSGFSAGGCLALSTAASLGPARVRGVAAFYPATDCTRVYPAPGTPFAAGYVIPKWQCDVFYDAYLVPGQARADPRVSPLFAQPERFPAHIYIACGEADTFHEQAEALARKLQAEKGGDMDVVFESVKGEAHAFDKLAKEGTASAVKRDEMYAGAADMINRAIG